MPKLFCPECDQSLHLGSQPHKGQRIICPDCGVNLTVVNLEPLQVNITNQVSSANGKPNTVNVDCPHCDEFVRLNMYVREGYQVTCLSCGYLLEVINTEPLELELAVIAAKMKQRRPKLMERPKLVERVKVPTKKFSPRKLKRV